MKTLLFAALLVTVAGPGRYCRRARGAVCGQFCIGGYAGERR
jgi:hypothetical protein